VRVQSRRALGGGVETGLRSEARKRRALLTLKREGLPSSYAYRPINSPIYLHWVQPGAMA
jgi:hypothetical protein